ncbi:MAG TPA: hypothetical protein VGA38_06450 [Candidatus Limnocylindria bacterium]
MIDRTEHDARRESKRDRETIDDDPHADHSADSDEHRGDGSEIASDEELRERAETDA